MYIYIYIYMYVYAYVCVYMSVCARVRVSVSVYYRSPLPRIPPYTPDTPDPSACKAVRSLTFTRYCYWQWCMVYGIQKRGQGGGGGGRMVFNSRAIVLQRCGQCSWVGGMKGRLICAQTNRRKRRSCKRQRGAERCPVRPSNYQAVSLIQHVLMTDAVTHNERRFQFRLLNNFFRIVPDCMGKSRINCWWSPSERETEIRSGTWAKRFYLWRLLSSCRAPLSAWISGSSRLLLHPYNSCDVRCVVFMCRMSRP